MAPPGPLVVVVVVVVVVVAVVVGGICDETLGPKSHLGTAAATMIFFRGTASKCIFNIYVCDIWGHFEGLLEDHRWNLYLLSRVTGASMSRER